MLDTPNIEELVLDDPEAGLFKVSRQSLVSPEIFALEQERIFDRCWLYIGHESELESTGDFRRRKVAGRPLIFVKGGDGEIRAFFNTCPHRGARVCRQDAGNAKAFQCFYHAWTFNTEGALVGIPDKEGYSEGFDQGKHGLVPVPRLDSYRGFWFVAFNEEIEDLRDYLAGATEYIDLVVDQDRDGLRILPGTNQYACNANWKLMVENSFDGYHGAPLHHTYFAFLASQGENAAAQLKSANARAYNLGNGHAVVDYPTPFPRAVANWHPMFGEEARGEIDEIRAELDERCGPERGERMAQTCRNLLIYPNLMLLDVSGLTIRTIWPQGPDYMELSAWALAGKNETPKQVARRLENFNLFLGPGGLATPDDVEALEACQEGFAALPNSYSDISRGMHRTPATIDEAQMRAFWREWHARMLGEQHAVQHEGLRETPVAEPAS